MAHAEKHTDHSIAYSRAHKCVQSLAKRTRNGVAGCRKG